MIIVSQDKTATTQSLNLGIDYTYNESGEFPDFKKEIVNYCIVDRKYNTILGEYSTEERAKEVLQEIVKVYVNGKKANEGNTLFGGFQWIPADTLYEMPKE